MGMGFKITRQCPKCYADRTMLDTAFGLPGYVPPGLQKDAGECVNVTSALPVKVILCPRCHYLEFYHDVESS